MGMVTFLIQLAGCLFLLAMAVLLLTAAAAWLLATVGAFRDVVRRQVLREAADAVLSAVPTAETIAPVTRDEYEAKAVIRGWKAAGQFVRESAKK